MHSNLFHKYVVSWQWPLSLDLNHLDITEKKTVLRELLDGSTVDIDGCIDGVRLDTYTHTSYLSQAPQAVPV